MGGDGQALANKRSLLQNARIYRSAEELRRSSGDRETQQDRLAERNKWLYCCLSLNLLEPPVAFDLCGNLFSKQSVVNHLIERKNSGSCSDDLWELKKLSDVSEAQNTLDPINGFSCPVTGYTTVSGSHKFVGMWDCGHVVAASALLVDADANAVSHDPVLCPVCEKNSFVVRLGLSPEKGIQQRTELRPLVRASRKRKRGDGDGC